MSNNVEIINRRFIEAVARGIKKPSINKLQLENITSHLRQSVLDRVAQGNYFGGEWANKPYSFSSIKAYKLGWAEVEGTTRSNQVLRIDGIEIDREDWFWGGYSTKQENFIYVDGRKRIAKQWFSISNTRSPEFHGSNPGVPAPVFIPGYKVWREKYKNLPTEVVDLRYTSMMLDDFGYTILTDRQRNKERRIIIEFETTSEHSKVVSHYTDYFRNWIKLTEDEVAEALASQSAELVSIVI